jgi:predicted metal-binding protein
VKRPTLLICTSCESDDARGDGRAFFEELKAARKAQKLKPWFRLKEAKCLDGCDTPCNARMKGGDREKVIRTWLDARDDVQPLLDAARRYAETGDAEGFPGRPG